MLSVYFQEPIIGCNFQKFKEKLWISHVEEVIGFGKNKHHQKLWIKYFDEFRTENSKIHLWTYDVVKYIESRVLSKLYTIKLCTMNMQL